jgi:hypothetical protein
VRLTMRDIQNCVAVYFNIPRDKFVSRDNSRCVARPRQIAMHLCRKHTSFSLPQIGRSFLRDHTTVLHGLRTIARLLEGNETVQADVEACEAMLAAGKPWLGPNKAEEVVIAPLLSREEIMRRDWYLQTKARTRPTFDGEAA